jgi:hypothetical protein
LPRSTRDPAEREAGDRCAELAPHPVGTGAVHATYQVVRLRPGGMTDVSETDDGGCGDNSADFDGCFRENSFARKWRR